MKRLFPAALAAILVHLLFLGMEFGWFSKKKYFHAKVHTVTMTLVQVEKKAPIPVMPPPPIFKEIKPEPSKPSPYKHPPPPPPKHVVQPAPIPDFSDKQELLKKAEVQKTKNTNTLPDALSKKVENPSSNTVTPSPDPVNNAPTFNAIPLYKVNPRPEYPKLARRRGYQGTVILDVLVDQNGRVKDLKIATSSGYSMLDQRAILSVKKWLFEPGKKGSRNVEMWVQVPIRFELK